MTMILDHLRLNASRWGDETAFEYPNGGGRWETITWQGALDTVAAMADYFSSCGVKAGDRVAIWSHTRLEWTLCDLALLSLKAVVVPIYHNMTTDQIRYILRDASVSVLMIEGEAQIPVAMQCVEEGVVRWAASLTTPWVNGIDKPFPGMNTLPPLEESERPSIALDDEATIVYTSGTTGEPKGVVLSHRQIMAEVEGLFDSFALSHHDRYLAFLPLAHIVARAVQFFQIYCGCVGVYAESIERFADNLKEKRPDFFVAVPRLLEKIHETIIHEVERKPRWLRRFFYYAVERGRFCQRRRRTHEPVNPVRCIEYAIYKRLLFSRIRRKLGGALRFVISGGAPLLPEVGKFLDAVGVPVIEGYGLTETTAAICVNSLADYHIGTVGRPISGAQVRIAEDGEVLVKGDVVFLRYHNRLEETKNAFTPDGWFKTGDIGSFSKEGFLRITARKKELIKTSGGKYISPQRIEELLLQSPFISQAMVVGEGRRFVSALLVPSREAMERYLREHGVVEGWPTVLHDPMAKTVLDQEVARANGHLAQFESVKRYAVLENEWTVAGGELTPTLKVRRAVIQSRFESDIDILYH